MTTRPMTVRFSIITITYNNRAGLKKTAASVKAQTCKNYEWIVIDGASTDGTQEDFINYLASQTISEPDNGIYDAMNKGLERATGKYIIFMNAGDQFASTDILQKISDMTGTKTYDLIYGDSLEETENGIRRKPAKAAETIIRGLFTHHQAIFYNRKSLEKLRYDTSYKIAADYDLTLRFLKEKRDSLYVPGPICMFEGGGISQRNIKLGRQEQFSARKKAGTTLPLNLYITSLQKTSSLLRAICPDLYWKLKNKKRWPTGA